MPGGRGAVVERRTSKLGVGLFDVTQGGDQLLTGHGLLVLQQVPGETGHGHIMLPYPVLIFLTQGTHHVHEAEKINILRTMFLIFLLIYPSAR